MANPGVGTKFVSVNLNKSYGQSHYQHQNNRHGTSHSGYYGSNRARSGGVGGMVVLLRPRSSQKSAGPKLSVPPPLNLPSMRKEHERFDLLGSSGGPAGAGSSSGMPRPSSSGMGWTKPGTAVAVQEKEGLVGADNGINDSVDKSVDGVNKVSSGSAGTYMPPSVRSSNVGHTSSTLSPVEKATVLRGEDFPSLKAALPSEKKQKDGLSQKQKQVVGQESGDNHRTDDSGLSISVEMRPRFQSGRSGVANLSSDSYGDHHGSVGSYGSGQVRKQEYFPGPLPLVRLNPRSDWADDERDTGHGFTDRDRNYGFSKSEAYWERDFDFLRPTVLPQKPAHNISNRWRQHDNETGKVTSSEVSKLDPFGRDVRTPNRDEREGNSWRGTPSLKKDGFDPQEEGNDRNGIGSRTSSVSRETDKGSKYMSSQSRDSSQDYFGRRDWGNGQVGKQPWNSMVPSYNNHRNDKNSREWYGGEQHNKFRGDVFHSNSVNKPPFSSGGKGPPIIDPILNLGRDNRSSLKSEKPYLEDPFMKDFGANDFDGHDPFAGGLIGVVKKKKEAHKQTDFYDPVRESFEIELERVQKIQEQERQRMIEEHERALEQARREEEERLRQARELEEQGRRLEEEAREAAWRAEQERSEAIRKAEEQRRAREEEKQRIMMEEERRKQAAKQKLLELEERIAKRQAEAANASSNSSSVVDEKLAGMNKERDIPKVSNADDWEDGERMVERITNFASDSGLNRPLDKNFRPNLARDSSSVLLGRGKPLNSWRMEPFDNGNNSTFISQDPENAHYSPRRDSTTVGRAFPKKDFYGGPSYMSARTYHKTGNLESHMDDFSHPRGQRWSFSGDGDHYGRNIEMESDFLEKFPERYGDVGWGQGQYRGNAYSQSSDRLYQDSETDELPSFGRSRYSIRHPRVLPPPSLTSMQRNSFRGETVPDPSSFGECEMDYGHTARNESNRQDFSSRHQVNHIHPEVDQRESTENKERIWDRNTAERCDSQSSLVVSSPPDSPVHLSHNELDESGDSHELSAAEEVKDAFSGEEDESVPLSMPTANENMKTPSSSVSEVGDEEWAVENNTRLQEQEEYDEDEDGYQEEEEAHEVDNENVNLSQEFGGMHLEKGSPAMVDNLILGFNEGVEVVMANDDFERSPRNEEPAFTIPQSSSASVVEEQGSFVGMSEKLQPVGVPSQVCINDSSRIFEDAEKAVQDLVIQPNDTSRSSTSAELTGHVGADCGSVVSTHHLSSSSVNVATVPSADQGISSAVSTSPAQADPPVKLQFGLFSGPSLIPSPVPAIQIGSIQMPLLHPQVGPSLSHIHPSQSPMFQFGQLRYTSPLSSGVLPLPPPQSLPFVQHNIPANFSVGPHQAHQHGQETSAQNLKNDGLSLLTDSHSGLSQRQLDLSQGNATNEVSPLPVKRNTETSFTVKQPPTEMPHIGDKETRCESGFHAQEQNLHESVKRNVKSLSPVESEGPLQTEAASSRSVSKERFSRPQGVNFSGRGKRYVVADRSNSGPKSSFLPPKASRSDSSGFQRRPRRQRTEFRVRDNADKWQSTGMVPPNHIGVDDKPSINVKGSGTFLRSGYRRVASNRSLKHTNEPESSSSVAINSREVDCITKDLSGAGKESMTKSKNMIQSDEGNHKRSSEDFIDAPLHSGVVQVFEQPGIEAPSDDDDFIEVKSKRQMLNDRREQREKEIKAKSRVSKMPRRPRATSQTTTVSLKSNKNLAPVSREAANCSSSDLVAAGRNSGNVEMSTGFSTIKVSQPLAPIGTPAVKSDTQADSKSQTIKSLQTSSGPVLASGGKNLSSGFIFDSKNKVLDNVQTSMSSWGNTRPNQQVMALTQTQLDEAMSPAQFDSRVSVHSSSVTEPSMPASSILANDKSFSSTASPINSLLAGEKIQFGAVTSPTLLPPSTRVVSHGIGPPGLCRSDIQISHNLSAAESDCPLLFNKDKHAKESCVNLEECEAEAEAEAEAAASAIAVAAISNDEIGGTGLDTCSVSVSETKSYGVSYIDSITAGVAGDQLPVNRSRPEDSLSVALPADLSVENPSISLWPPLASPPNSSSQMISHFPGGPPSHFPFYDMNHMLGSPIFTFGPHDESVPAQSQAQKTSTAGSTPLGTWQQCHSGVDSFYGSPAGYTSPFIGPTGGISGVQGPPHMVVYNHFAPVGQFGQVGLSFMGATYIPSGKQPDWKHNPVSSAMGVSEGEVNKLNIGAAQRNTTNLPAQIQHLAPGSPLMPMASPLAMFDVSPYQSSHDLSVQTRWPHVPAPPLQSVPVSMPLQQKVDGSLPQFNHTIPVEPSSTANRFAESQTSTPSDSGRSLHAAANPTVSQLPDELGLVDTSSTTNAGVKTQSVVAKSLSLSDIADAGKMDTLHNGSSSTGISQNMSTAFKPQIPQQKNMNTHQHDNSSGYSHQRGGGVSHKNSSGGEWPHRRVFHGRNQSFGAEKSFPPSKMKQIYVAKQTPSGTSTAPS